MLSRKSTHPVESESGSECYSCKHVLRHAWSQGRPFKQTSFCSSRVHLEANLELSHSLMPRYQLISPNKAMNANPDYVLACLKKCTFRLQWYLHFQKKFIEQFLINNSKLLRKRFLTKLFAIITKTIKVAECLNLTFMDVRGLSRCLVQNGRLHHVCAIKSVASWPIQEILVSLCNLSKKSKEKYYFDESIFEQIRPNIP